MKAKKAFSIVEIITVISIIMLLVSILLPCLARSRAQGRQIICKSNSRQLYLANSNYAQDNEHYYVLGASDTLAAESNSTDNCHRWYGSRKSRSEPFDITKGPLFQYADIGQLACPQNVRYMQLQPDERDYDCGSGGYGYNLIYIGSKIWINGYEDASCKTSAKESDIRTPVQTLMFADAAMVKENKLIEYSFAEPRYFLMNGKPNTEWDPAPSIHFRHAKKTSVCWSDGHSTAEKMTKVPVINDDMTVPAEFNLGWFAPADNSCFDLE